MNGGEYAGTDCEASEPIAREPELTKRAVEPKGVLQKNLKPMLYLGAALLVIVAAIFSGTGKKTPTQKSGTPNQPPQPTLQDSTDNNVQDLKNQVAAAQQKAAQQSANPADPSLAAATPAQQAAAQAYGPTGQPVPCVPGQPCAQGQQQLSPAAQEEQQLAAKDRDLAFDSRFASNLVFARAPDPPQQPQPAQTITQSSPARQPAVSLRRAPWAIRPPLQARKCRPSAGRRSISTRPRASPM